MPRLQGLFNDLSLLQARMRVEVILYTKYLVRDLAEADVYRMNAKTLT